MEKTNVGILLFDDVEVLDFAGPFEVFSRTRLEPGLESRRSNDSAPFEVFTVAHGSGSIRATGGLVVTPDYSFDNVPHVDLLVVPGGFGTRSLLDNQEVLDWIRETAGSAGQTASVCTGALLLARAGLLENQCATTHWGALDLLETMDPSVTVQRDERVVMDRVVTSAGVAAGIDMAFALVERMFGVDIANETARYMEYHRG